MQFFYNESILGFFTYIAYSFYFYQIFMFSDSVLEKSIFNTVTRLIVSIINGALVSVFFINTLWLPLMISYLVFFTLLSLNFLFFYKGRYLNKLFFVSAYMLHFMTLSSIIMSLNAIISDKTLFAITYSTVSMLHTIILIALVGGSAIAVVRKLIPSIEIKIINNHNVQLYFMIVWISVFNILMLVNANIFSIDADFPVLRTMQILMPIAVLIGLYVVLFFSIQTGKLLGYKDKTLELQEQMLKNEKKRNELQEKADHDPLTKLFNKEVTGNLIDEYIHSQTSGNVCALFLIDIDNFKSANDERGHIFGDELLIEVSSSLHSLFRNDDVVGRIGGDEFMVFMKNIINENAVRVKATEICHAFYKTFEKKDSTLGHISASVGIALFPSQANDYTGLYKLADEALYVAKEKGKNTYAFFGEK